MRGIEGSAAIVEKKSTVSEVLFEMGEIRSQFTLVDDDCTGDLCGNIEAVEGLSEVGASQSREDRRQGLGELLRCLERKLGRQDVHREDRRTVAVAPGCNLTRRHVIDVDRISRFGALDRALNRALNIATQIADDPEPRRRRSLMDGAELVNGDQAGIALIPVVSVHEDREVGEILGESGCVPMRVLVVILKFEMNRRFAGSDDVLLLECDLIETA